MSAVISENKRIIQVGRDPKRSPVQTPTENKITTKYVIKRGWSGTLLLPSTDKESTITLGSLYHGLSVLLGRRFILIGSKKLPWFNYFPLSMLSHLVLLCRAWLCLFHSLPVQGSCCLLYLKLSLLQDEQDQLSHDLLIGKLHQASTAVDLCALGPVCNVFHVLEDQNQIQYSRCREQINAEWMEVVRFLSLPAVPLIIQLRMYVYIYVSSGHCFQIPTGMQKHTKSTSGFICHSKSQNKGAAYSPSKIL